MTEVKPLESLEQLEQLNLAAAEDDHILIAPTHMIEKEGEPIGYVSINGMPMVHWWLHTQKGSAMDTLRIMVQLESEAAKMGINKYQLACADTSPYYPKMRKLGFTSLGDTTLFRKAINHG